MKKQIFLLTFLSFFLANTLNSQTQNCLDFTSGYDRLYFPTPISGTDDFTLEAWFKSDNNTGSLLARLFTWWGNGTRFEVGDRNGQLQIFEHDGSSHWINTGVNIVDGNWHFVSITRESNSFKIYVDGILKSTHSRVLLMNNNLSVGHWNGTLTSLSQWIGRIDEIRLWNIVRTESEIQSTMNLELSGNEPGLVAYLDFNQGIANGNNIGLTTAIDKTGNGFDGVLDDFSLIGNTSNWVGSGAPISMDDCPIDPFDDIDGDGICGDVDNCPDIANTDQSDLDGDGQGDVCDPCPNDPDNDIDGDDICGDVDNCPDDANTNQEDLDQDGIGDICDISMDIGTVVANTIIIIQNLNLSTGRTNFYINKLENAIDKYCDGKLSQAEKFLGDDFIDKVNSDRTDGSITDAEADELIAIIDAIITAMMNGEIDCSTAGARLAGSLQDDIFQIEIAPNPFERSTMINFTLEEDKKVTLVIYDITGKQVKVLVDGILESGDQQIEWNAQDESRKLVPGGIYYFRIQAGTHVETRSIVRVH